MTIGHPIIRRDRVETRHTPGPWEADVRGPFALGGDMIAVEAVTDDGREVRREICTLMIDTSENDDTPEAQEDKANARLIAESPVRDDLLRRLVAAADDGFAMRGIPGMLWHGWDDLLSAIRASLRETEGSS
jgi:hypothetical protein